VTPITVEFLLDGYLAARADVIDISATGLGMLAMDAFGPDEGYDIRLACERAHPHVVEITAVRVVWCDRVGQNGRRRGGVRFDRGHMKTRLALDSLIQATCPAGDPPSEF
jgi:c-di-GMP-binding flagellar brake protein YcgR